MLINRLKTCKPIDLDSKLKEYVIKNYDNESLTDKVKQYFSSLNQNRNVIAQMGEVQDNQDQIKQNINIISEYLNQIIALKQKMTFGKESYSCKVEFIWTDTIKGSKWDSYNIFFEFYNTMFNLATNYYNLASIYSKTATDKSGHRDANKYFKYAMYTFDVIKEEAASKIPEKELPLDLFPDHLEYCKTLCEIQGQLEVYTIAKETNPKSFDLHAKLLHTVSDLYNKARNLADGPQTRKGTKDELLYFLSNRGHYYKAMMYRDMKENAKKKYDSSGEHYGEILVMQGLFVQALLECQKTIKKCGILVDQDGFEKMVEEEKAEGANIEDLNNRIYHQAVPKMEDLVFEKRNMMTMALPEDIYIRENADKLKQDEKVYCPDLDLLVPKQVKGMIDNYKTKMNEFIMKNLDLYENENTIQEFVQNLFLPKKLTTRPGEEDLSAPPAEFPPQLWQKIEQVQELGGGQCLSRIMNGIMNKSNYLIKELEKLLKFREKWIREPSQKLNFKLVQASQQYIGSLNNTKKFDQQEMNDIMNNMKFFDELMLPRDQLLNRIPRREELKEKEIPEETEVREAIMKLYDLGDKCLTVIRPIYNELNDDSKIVGEFIDVLAKKTTEQAIYDKYKEVYEAKFNELKPLSDDVKQYKETVNEIVQRNSQKIRDKPKQDISNEAMEFFRMVDQYCNLFMNKYEKVKKGDKYYNDLYQKITQLIKSGNDWMIKRSDEKNAILSTFKNVKGLAPNVNRQSSSDVLDPSKNLYTNMNVQNNQRNFGMPNNYNNQQGGFNNNQGGFNGQQGGFGGNNGY